MRVKTMKRFILIGSFLVFASLLASVAMARLPDNPNLTEKRLSALELQVSSLKESNANVTEEILTLRNNLSTQRTDLSKSDV